MKVAIRYQMIVEYDRGVNLSPHVFRLRPVPHCRIPILSYSLKIVPENKFINWQQDPFGNILARVVFPEKTTKLSVEAELIAEMIEINPFDFFVESYAANFPFDYTAHLKKELRPYFEVKEKGQLFEALLSTIDRTNEIPINDFLVALNQAIWMRVTTVIIADPKAQLCEETLSLKSGSCRDIAWLLVQAFRHLGFAARFVSGYLLQLTADQKIRDVLSVQEKDFGDLHAWTEVYIPGAGWIGLDATSGLFAGEGHISFCCTPDPISAAPVTGITEFCETTVCYKNDVVRIHEDSTIHKPYSDEQWASIIGLGNKIEEELLEGDMRLAIGGELTFVSLDNKETEAWNTTLDSDQRSVLGKDLIQRLKNVFAPGGLIHISQGKWYPGEPLPSRQYAALWRKDGYPIWKNAALIDLSEEQSSYTLEDVKKLADELANYLNLPRIHIHPALEDHYYAQWEEGKVPPDIDPYSVDLNNFEERRKLAEKLQSGIGKTAGFVLPIEWNHWENKWLSSEWKFRNNHLYLVPGNSPMGLRLPLKALSEISKSRVQREIERSPFEELPVLEAYHKKVKDRYSITNIEGVFPKEYRAPSLFEKGEEEEEEKAEEKQPLFDVFVVKTAICLELREGKIYLFMPPLNYLEHYLDLIASIEAAVSDLNLKVVIEGYEAPFDKRTTKLAVIPDPSVVKVMVPPAKNWSDLLLNYELIFEQTSLSRLSTEKFNADGKPISTGGGSQIAIGGTSPEDSPILRKPDMLRSMITYWQQHPGLSYLFSTPSVGPMSEAPRVDEGRQEILYELEIAFNQLPEGEYVPFWKVDRIFRNLLIDITGNSKHAEFCIDNLYAPGSSSGRLGIVVLQGFDMPPNKQLCIVQQLLIRSLLAWFWKNPYKSKLIRWGNQLNDKFMLPHYVQQDMKNIITDLQDAGYPFQYSWLEPFFEFRFPLYGKIKIEDIELELRMGIEPWRVLGEESSSLGKARYIDSSVEKIEVKVKNFNLDRYRIMCNGSPVELAKTEIKGEFVAGIRYRVSSPPSALHPMLAVDVPLVFELIDTRNQKSIGGCTYFVAHSERKSYNYNNYPIKYYEAKGQRPSRFWGTELPAPKVFTPTENDAVVSRYVEPNNLQHVFGLKENSEEYHVNSKMERPAAISAIHIYPYSTAENGAVFLALENARSVRVMDLLENLIKESFVESSLFNISDFVRGTYIIEISYDELKKKGELVIH